VGKDHLRIAYEEPASLVGMAEAHLRERVDLGLRPPPLVRRDRGVAG
jgi:hypothetical protein